MSDNRILLLDSDVPSIYFPIGSLAQGGTCEFSTEECREKCPSGGMEEVTAHEKFSYDYFLKHNENTIFKKLLDDFNELTKTPRNAKLIQWFTWGDCTVKLTGKIIVVILKIKDIGIPQYGFTRNKMLWEMIPENEDLSIGLSIDDLDEARKVSIESGKMTAHPDFGSNYAEMIFDGKIVARCNGWWCKILDTEEKVIEERESNCTTCHTSSQDNYTGGKGHGGCW